MKTRMQCAESMRVQAYFDGELDALSAADIERHSEVCAACRALLEDLDHMRGALRQDPSYAHSPPPALRARILRVLDQESSRQSPRDSSRHSSQQSPRAGWMR